MKKLLTILGIIGLFLFGCSDLGTNPESQFNSSGTIAKSALSVNTYQIIDFPNPAVMGSDDGDDFDEGMDFSVTKTIDGNEGGKLSINKHYKTEYGNVNISATLRFPRGSFEGSKDISMKFNLQDNVIEFEPHLVFDEGKPAEFDFQISNAILDDVDDSDNVQFVYFGDGFTETMKNSGIDLNKLKKYLMVKKAELPHFSVFGFVK